MDKKDLIDTIYKQGDLLVKNADLLNKKALMLLASNGGIATVFVKVDLKQFIENILILVFILLSLGIITIYVKISKINQEVNKLNREIERLKND